MKHKHKKYFGGWILTLIIGVLLIIAIIMAITIVGPSDGVEDNKDQMKIGVLLPLTGNQESIGNEYLKGIKLAVEDLKKDGINLTLIIKDTKSDTGTAIDEFLKLNKEGIRTIVGPSSANDAEKIALYAEIYRDNLITLANTNNLSKYGDYVFKYVPTEPSVASAINNIIIKIDEEQTDNGNNNRKVCILYSKDTYGYSMQNLLIDTFEKDKSNKFEIKSFEIPENITDENSIEQLINDIVKESPQYICVFTTNPETFVTIDNASHDKLPNVFWIGTDYILEKSVAEKLKNTDNTFVLSLTRTMTDDFRTKYENMFGNKPEVYSISVISYDAVITLGNVIKVYGTNPDHISEGLKNIRRIGLTGVNKFDQEGNRCLGFLPYVLQDGKWVPEPWKQLAENTIIWK